MYAKINNQQVVQYPYSLTELRAEYPDTSFPASMTNEQLAEFNVVQVFASSQPTHDAITQSVDEAAPAFVQASNRWEQQWTVRSATAEEVAARKQALQAEIVAQTQKRLDTFARTRNYDGILSACTYADSTVPKFQAEGVYCVSARDQTWATLYQIMAEVEAGTRPMPSGYADIEGDLPVLTWPV